MKASNETRNEKQVHKDEDESPAKVVKKVVKNYSQQQQHKNLLQAQYHT